MNSSLNKFAIIALLLFFVQSTFGQIYQFKEFSIEEGLSHPFVYTVAEDNNGFIWIGTGEGLCRFDGFEFTVSEIDDSLTNGFVTSSYLGSDGLLWFGHNSGQITTYNGSEFKLLETSEDIKSSIVGITGDSNGNVFIATQNSGLLKVSKDFKVEIFSEDFSEELIYAIQFAGNNNFLIATSEGLSLYKYKDDSFIKEFAIKELEYITIQAIKKGRKENTFWIGTEDSGFFLVEAKGEMFDSYVLTNMGEKYELAFENVQSVLEDKENTLWISTFGKGLYKLIPENKQEYTYKDVVHYSTENGLSNNFIKTVYQDWEGNYWIGTFGNGLSFSVDEALTIQYQDIDALNGDVLSVAETDSYLWLGGNAVIAKINKSNNDYTIINTANGLPNDKIIAIYADPKQKLWIGTEKNGIYHLDIKTNKVRSYYKSNNSMGNSINHITGIDNKVFVSTQNGVLVFDIVSGKSELYNTAQGLPHNDIKSVFIDSDKHPWIATRSHGIIVLNSDLNYSIAGNVNLVFTSVTEDVNGDLWAVTYGDGAFKFEQDSIIYFSTDNGLKSNYCYSIISDNAGQVWIGHKLGMSSIDINTGEIRIMGTEKGITGDCNYNATIRQKNGVILTGTTDGLIVYDRSKEKENIFPPRLNITQLLFSDVKVDFTRPVVLPYDIYKLNIGFVGLSYSDPKGVSYQYMLDGYDLEWSDVNQNRVVSYPRVEDGNYTFILKACNAEGFCVEEPLEIKISIRPPFWKTWWFISLSIITGIALIYSYIKYREKKQKAMREYLENELQKRTKEVYAQKEELEIKNRDITDSINYAQRIQQSILPSVNTINENFSGAFVYYQPRDIVSGDFYWYERVNDDKFLIVCADSTGHGVPGAFMSMIGTTLIKDICLRKDINSPSAVLDSLDKELQGTLNQNIDAERAHDGMDIIVCEIDVKTYYMRFASAMRPLILYKDKELQYVKGTKASIGGDPKAEKRFENIGFQLHQGDIIYMFSDGYPDQFGGPRGKKFKLDRVKNMLADVCDKSMEDQQDYVGKIFNDWRGRLQQVDDVLFMGVRI